MKKKIFGGIAVLAIAVAVAFNVNLNLKKSNSHASLLALANVEALAGETETGAQSIMLVDQGTTSDCVNGYVTKVHKVNVYCYGTGSLSCTSGTLTTTTTTSTRCYFV